MAILKVKNREKCYNLIEIIKILNIGNTRSHLTEGEFKSIYKLYRGDLKGYEATLNYNLKGMEYTIKKYSDVDLWEKAALKDKISIKIYNHSNLLYYQIMVLLGRVSLDVDVLNNYNLPSLLLEEEKSLIVSALEKIGYSKATNVIINAFNKLRFYILKDLKLVTEDDFYKFYHDVNNIKPYKMFNVLKFWGNIPLNSTYSSVTIRNRKYCVDIIKTCHKNIRDLYFEFKDYVNNSEYKHTALKKISICKKFIEWLNLNYNFIDDLRKIEYEHVCLFISYIKTTKVNKNRKYAISTINAEISRLKNGILKYLLIKNIVSEDLKFKVFSDDSRYDELYYKKTKGLPKPISMNDRKLIEKALFKEYDDIDKLIMDVMRLCYFLGARPSEVISLKINCIKGVEQAPSIHIHRTKGFSERYIPLIDDAYKIVDYWTKINKYSMPVYLQYDKETAKRLFQNLGKVYALGSIERSFNNLMVRNNIVDSDNKSKYTLYVLRKIRITTWLENGLSEEEVAYLVGHENIDSHNSYIVSKELRKNNAKKVYNNLYKDILENKKETEESNVINNSDSKKNELDEFINVLKEIENKNLNLAIKESIIKEFNEFVIPLPCGSCLAKAYDENFQCAIMELPCLECDRFKIENVNVESFNEFVKRLFIGKNDKKKKGLDGLVMKTEHQLERFKEFYVNRLKINSNDVNNLFIDIEKSVKVKRGRPKKGR